LGCCSIVVSILLEYDSASMGNSLHTFWENDGLKMLGVYYPLMWENIPGEWKYVIITLFCAITSLQVTSSLRQSYGWVSHTIRVCVNCRRLEEVTVLQQSLSQWMWHLGWCCCCAVY
jgi:hypothetical protein